MQFFLLLLLYSHIFYYFGVKHSNFKYVFNKKTNKNKKHKTLIFDSQFLAWSVRILQSQPAHLVVVDKQSLGIWKCMKEAGGTGTYLWPWVSFNNTLKHHCVPFFDGVDPLVYALIFDITRSTGVHDLGVGRGWDWAHIQTQTWIHAYRDRHKHRGKKTCYIFSKIIW